MQLPAGYSIVEAESDIDFRAFATLALEYSRWLGVDLCFQAFDKELASLPGCYSRPTGCILLLQHQPSPETPAQAVGCVAVRPLSTNSSAHATHHSDPATAAADSVVTTQQHLPSNPQPQQQSALSCQDVTEHSKEDAHAMSSEQQVHTCSTESSRKPVTMLSTDSTAAATLRSVCEMKRLWVSQGHTGKGLGRALAMAAVTAARQCGYSCMVLDTLQTLTAANKLYGELGFVQCDAYYPNPLPDVVYWQLQL